MFPREERVYDVPYKETIKPNLHYQSEVWILNDWEKVIALDMKCLYRIKLPRLKGENLDANTWQKC